MDPLLKFVKSVYQNYNTAIYDIYRYFLIEDFLKR